MTRASSSLFFFTVAVLLSLSHCAYHWRGRPIALRAVNNTLDLYRLVTNDPPDSVVTDADAPNSTCRKWSWIHSSTNDFFTWKEDKKDFLSDLTVSYFDGGIMSDTNLSGLLVLARQMECSGGFSEQKKEDGLRVFSAADGTRVSRKLQVSRPLTEKEYRGAFEFNGRKFWAVASDGEDSVHLKEMSVNQGVVNWLDYGAFSLPCDPFCYAVQVLQLKEGVHLLSISGGSSVETDITYILGNLTDNGSRLHFEETGPATTFDWGDGAQNFVFAQSGSDVFAIGWIRDNGEKSLAKEVWRNGMTVIRKIELHEGDIIQKPVGLGGSGRSGLKKLVEKETPLPGSFSFRNEGTSVLNLTFHHSANFKNGGYIVRLSDGIDNKEFVDIKFNEFRSAEVKDYYFSVTSSKGYHGHTPLWRNCALSGNLLAIVGLDVIEVYLEGGKFVITAFNPVDKPFTKMTISPLGEGQIILKEASYRTFGPSGKSSDEAVHVKAGGVDTNELESSGSTSDTPAVLSSNAADSIPSVSGPLNTRSMNSTTTSTKTAFDSTDLALTTSRQTASDGTRAALSWAYMVACLTILM